MAESQRQTLCVKLLPKRAAKILKSSLDYLYYQIRNSPVNTQETNGHDDIELEFQRRKKEVFEYLNARMYTYDLIFVFLI